MRGTARVKSCPFNAKVESKLERGGDIFPEGGGKTRSISSLIESFNEKLQRELPWLDRESNPGCVNWKDFGSKGPRRRKSWFGFFIVCATNLQIIIHSDLPSFEESFTRATYVFHAYSLVDYVLVDLRRVWIRGKPFERVIIGVILVLATRINIENKIKFSFLFLSLFPLLKTSRWQIRGNLKSSDDFSFFFLFKTILPNRILKFLHPFVLKILVIAPLLSRKILTAW